MNKLLRRQAVSPLLFTAAVGFAGLTAACGPPISASVPALEARVGCSLWAGRARGNDSVRLELELCPAARGGELVVGRVQMTSPRSGWSVRRVGGKMEEDGTLRLHDVDMTVDDPELGWMFCLVDDYELARDPERTGRVSGYYTSRSCDDHATVRLWRVGDGE